jgi:hypothetical protein
LSVAVAFIDGLPDEIPTEVRTEALIEFPPLAYQARFGSRANAYPATARF